MPDSLQSLGILVFALLPGALFTWSVEGRAGRWGISFSDRILRFVGTSAFVHALLAPLSFGVWRGYVQTGRLGRGEVPLWLWSLLLSYVTLPRIAGRFMGNAIVERKPWTRFVTDTNPAPRAWDYLFGTNPTGVVRLKLKSGPWIAGVFGTDGNRRSYASGYPEDGELFLVSSVAVDAHTGQLQLKEVEDVIPKAGLLVRWQEVEYLEFISS